MENFNESNKNFNNKRTIALETPPLPPTSQRTEGQRPQNHNTDPQKLKRTLARRRYAETFHLKQISRLMKLEWKVQALEADVERDSAKMYYWKRLHYLFQVENGELKQKICFFSHEIEFKEDQYMKLKKEKDELKGVYVDQQKHGELMQRLSNMANAELINMDRPEFPIDNFM